MDIDADALASVRDRIDSFVSAAADGDDGAETTAADLTGLDLYLHLEAATPLLGLHTMLRRGPANRMRSGLQQSYGDHNRLLALGLDALVAGDVDWLASRVDAADPPTRSALEHACRAVAELDVDRRSAVALWVAAALHDIGMLVDDTAGLDTEHAGDIARPFVDALGLGDQWPLVHFVIRHHDYVKDVYTGEVPASLIAADLDRLAEADRRLALSALGMVQIAGSASLGEGRLSAHRVQIMARCASGAVLDDVDDIGRVARLVEGPSIDVDDASRRTASQWATGAGYGYEQFWDRAVLHGWRHIHAAASTLDDTSLDPAGLFADSPWSPRVANALGAVAAIWSSTDDAPDHVVVTPGAAAALAADGRGADVHASTISIGADRALRLDARRERRPHARASELKPSGHGAMRNVVAKSL